MSSNRYQNFSFCGSYMVLRTTETFQRTESGKNWRRAPFKVENEVFTPEKYENFVKSIPFFNDWGGCASSRAYWNNTRAGYVPTRITTVSFDGREKQIDYFQFINTWDLLKNAGWREREIIEKAYRFNLEKINGHDILYLCTHDAGVTASGAFDLDKGLWVD